MSSDCQPPVATDSDLRRKHTTAFTKYLGISPFEAIPPGYRPADVDALDNILLKTLIDLAERVPNLHCFRVRLCSARQRRRTTSPLVSKEFSIQICDVFLALHDLDREERVDSVALVRPTSSDRKSSPVTSIVTLATDTQCHVARLRGKSGGNSLLQVKTLYPSPSHTTSPTLMAHPLAKYKAASRRATYDGNMKVSTDDDEYTPPLKQKRGKRHTTNKFGKTDGTSTNPATALFLQSMLPAQKRGAISELEIIKEETMRATADAVAAQREHALYFPLPKDQHFKKRVPLTIRTVEELEGVDLSMLTYPVEVPARGKGTWDELTDESDLEEWVVKQKAKKKRKRAGDPTAPKPEPASPTSPAPSTTCIHPAKKMLQQVVLDLSSSMFLVNGLAIRTSSRPLDYEDKDRVTRIMDSFMRDVRDAQAQYEDRLKVEGVLPSDPDELFDADLMDDIKEWDKALGKPGGPPPNEPFLDQKIGIGSNGSCIVKLGTTTTTADDILDMTMGYVEPDDSNDEDYRDDIVDLMAEHVDEDEEDEQYEE